MNKTETWWEWNMYGDPEPVVISAHTSATVTVNGRKKKRDNGNGRFRGGVCRTLADAIRAKILVVTKSLEGAEKSARYYADILIELNEKLTDALGGNK